MDDHPYLPEKAPGRPGSGSPPGSQAERIAILTASLALVRPVGMTADEVEDWLSVALGEVGSIPLGMFRQAASAARKTATHYAQIVPEISKAAAPLIAAADSVRIAASLPVPTALPKPRMPQHVFERIVAERGRSLSSALDSGEIVSLGGGRFELA